MIAKFIDFDPDSNSSIEFAEAIDKTLYISVCKDYTNPGKDITEITLSYDSVSELIDFLIKIQTLMNKSKQ